ncbi:hypothetical protein SAMN05892883_2719 [Jatrophihabitans sp. GAS493]|uniref:DAK2 domain-containing protein n=1 Tax=Jatrophihabitans sp. GAS493 TaxID=1907575 RepID=UPI000BB9479C|nr:DAK2 domain-containing protein [Jatrophihabitans sp. GAS493]SOD73427.1 hypothetical protein SAMN05892883_2719 [Jatrophihabitans sp. GAS493]
MLDRLDAPAIRQWSIAAAAVLEEHRQEIDELNVFPVPDGDTGTNLALTVRAAADALALDASASASAALQAMARGAVLGARGNSGVILSQILRGLADEQGWRPSPPSEPSDDRGGVDRGEDDRGEEGTGEQFGEFGAASLQHGLRNAAERAYEAVNQPIEGTILSVVRAAADAAQTVRLHSGALADVVRAAAGAAADALARTPEQLPVLARAGVVDAGGRGLVLLIEALAGVITGTTPAATTSPPRLARSLDALSAEREIGSDEFAYEVQYLLEAGDAQVTLLRGDLAPLGDSLVVVGTGDGVWNVHVHVNDVGAAIEAGIQAGRPYRITVTRFADALPTDSPTADGTAPSTGRSATGPALRSGTAIVAVAPGEGLAHLFTAEGVVVVEGGPSANPSTAEVLAAVRSSGAAHVVLLPNASQIAGVAEAAAHEARVDGIEVSVVPTKSPVQGLAAVAVHDGQRRFDDNVVAMAEAAAATRWAEVTVAQRESLTSVGQCQPGDILGLIDGEVVVIGAAVGEVAGIVVDRLVGIGAELITVLIGRDAVSSDVETLLARLAASAPLVEVSVFDGGQPHYPLLIGAE